MKDLLADLQDDGEGDGWLSLEQLERELSQLDDNSGAAAMGSTTADATNLASLPLPPAPTAASMVVTGQQQFQHQQQQQQPAIQGVGLLGDVTVTTAPAADAWKESLQKFTAMSLTQDFLAADTVRKQQQGAPAAPQLPPGFMSEAADYDANEKVTIMPPPGMASGGPPPPPGIKPAAEEDGDDVDDAEREKQAKLAAASLLPNAVPSIPKGKSLPKTPQNSQLVTSGQDATPSGTKARVATRMPKTPRNSAIVSSADEAAEAAAEHKDDDDIPTMGKVTILKRDGAIDEEPTKQVPKTPRNSVLVPSQEAAAAVMPHGMAMPPPNMMMQGMPPQGPPHPGMMPPPNMMMQGMPPPPHPHMMVPPGAVPVGMPAPGGPAWQTGPRPPPPQPPRRPVFCNPHPNAPPIPAQVLESRLMKSRDISYIIHSILKPVLMAGFSEYDYDIQLLFRQSGGRPFRPNMGRRTGGGGKGGNNKNANGDASAMEAVEREMASREKKSKEWSAKNAVLGAVTKSNVARPRALIASPVIAQGSQDKAESASEQKQRARLWKARIYCDQAYQAYLDVVDIWAKAAPGSVPPQVHGPLIRLMKCLGISPVATTDASKEGPGAGGDFKVDTSVLELFLKLSKGRTLFSRIVEQALLPPSAIQAVLPSTLEILYKSPIPGDGGNQGANGYEGNLTDDRCFRAVTSVVQTLPSLSGDTVLKCAETMKANSEASFSSTARMECLHALLQRGNGMAGNPDPSLEAYKAKWTETESSFLSILSGM